MVRRLAGLALLMGSTAALAQGPAQGQAAPGAAALNATLTAPLPADQAAMKAHVLFLAANAMKGREAGSPEYDIAAQYVAAQFYAAGLRPGGDEGGYLQHVPLVSYKAADKGSLVLTGRGSPQPLVFGEDYVPAPNAARAETSVSTGLVFVGYGVDAPQYGHDDFAKVDVRGRIVVYVAGAPAGFGGEERAFFGSGQTKLRTAAAHGAVGAIQLGNVTMTAEGMARLAEGYDRPRMTWATAAGVGNADGVPLLATVGPAGAAKLFAGSRTPWGRVVAEAGKPAPRFTPMALAGTLTVATRTGFTPAASSNVVGVIPGSDPVVGRQVLVLSAHLDHIGVGRPVNGDAINNGALDNAIGIASLIEEAKRFTASGTAPKRSVMFLAVTGEEKGLVGSDYFVNHPVVPLANIVADVNLDMPILLYTFEDMIVYGAERSTLGPIVRRAVESAGVELAPDPMPEQGIFVRSDHFRFVQKGIPAVFLWPGQKGPGKAATELFMANGYHKPADDLSQPIRWDQGVRFVDVNYRIAREIADGTERPLWNRGDYFAGLYKGPVAPK